MVGDDDQSIYSFRWANYKNITTLAEHFPEITEIKLEQNYRSTKNILLAANSIIKNNKDRKTKELWTGNAKKMKNKRESLLPDKFVHLVFSMVLNIMILPSWYAQIILPVLLKKRY